MVNTFRLIVKTEFVKHKKELRMKSFLKETVEKEKADNAYSY